VLQLLRLKNIAIVSELELEFCPGLNVITGETGAGKSLVLRGLELLRGARGSSDLIRTGQEKAEIEALFTLTPEARERTVSDLRADFEWADEILAEDEVILRRVVDANGRGKILINGRLSTRAELAAVAAALFDITGQHSQQRLLEKGFHLACLDQFGVSKELLASVQTAFLRWSEVAKRFERARSSSAERQEQLRRLAFERDELKEAGLRAGERLLVEAELKRASSVEALSSGIAESLRLLDDDENGVEHTASRLEGLLSKLLRLDSGLGAIAELAAGIGAQISELRLQLEEYSSSLEIDPAHLEQLRERLSELARLERKYGRSTDELVEYFDAISKELALYESGSYELESLQKEVTAARDALSELEQKLTAERKKVAERFALAVDEGLAALEMKRARFTVEVNPSPSTERGADAVAFHLAANPGEPAHPLAEVASGGELSRVLLVLKTLLNEQTTPVLQIFDEIDVGLGGATAQVLGEKLRSLSPRFQLIVVTHAPQIAALGERHLVIEKESTESRTDVSVRRIDEESRVMEIARMLAGREVTEQFVRSARELVSSTSGGGSRESRGAQPASSRARKGRPRSA